MQIVKYRVLLSLLVLFAAPSLVQPGSHPGFKCVGQAKEQRCDIPIGSTSRVYDAGIAVVPPACPPLYTFTGAADGDQFGNSVSCAGDVDADGYDDLIVGALFNDAGGDDVGRGYVFSGQTGDTIHIFTGEAAGDVFGNAVASAGDVNGDGFADLIIGAPVNDAFGIDVGRAYVFSGQTGDTIYVFTGEADDDWLGWSVASAGDVNNDGFDDLIVGAPQNGAGGNFAGRAYVFSGQSGDTVHVFTGETAVDLLGVSVASAGDVNSDGYADLIIGASGFDAAGVNRGRAYVFSGRTGDTIHVFTGGADGDGLGWSVASAGDVNNDGFDDLIVGASRNDAGGVDAGRAYVYSGRTGGMLHVFTGEAADDRFSFSVASAGDVNSDGSDDLIIGAWGNDAGGINAGRAYLFSGQTGDTIHVFTGGQGNAWLGTSVASAGDVDNGESDDLIIGAPGNDSFGINIGRAYVYLMEDTDGDGIGDACCCGLRGDCDGSGAVNVSDLTSLVSYLFQGGVKPGCPEEGDADASGETNVSDLTYLVAYLFQGGPPPPPC